VRRKGTLDMLDAASQFSAIYKICQGLSELNFGPSKVFISKTLILYLFWSSLLPVSSRADGKDMCINIYDVRLSDTYPSCGMHWPTTLSATYDYLKRPDVRKAFHVDEISKPEAWVECSNRVHTSLTDGSTTQAAVTLLPGLLKSGMEIMLFAGDQDLICNHLGVERLVENLNWGGSKGFSVSFEKEVSFFLLFSKFLIGLFPLLPHVLSPHLPSKNGSSITLWLDLGVQKTV